MDLLSFHSHGKNSSFSFIWENKFYVSSCGKQRLWRGQNNPSLSHRGKQSSIPCGSNNIRGNNHLSLSHVETIFMWSRKKKQQPFLLLFFSLMCWNDPFSQIILSFMYIVEFYIWLLPWCCSPCSSSSIFFFSSFLPHFVALVPFSSIFCVTSCSSSCISTWQ